MFKFIFNDNNNNKKHESLLKENEDLLSENKKLINEISLLKIENNLFKSENNRLKEEIKKFENYEKINNNNKRIRINNINDKEENNKYKTKLCINYKDCPYGNKCTFAHDLKDIKCVNWTSCFNEKCKYYHPVHWNAYDNKKECNVCKNGNSCNKINKRYIHK